MFPRGTARHLNRSNCLNAEWMTKGNAWRWFLVTSTMLRVPLQVSRQVLSVIYKQDRSRFFKCPLRRWNVTSTDHAAKRKILDVAAVPYVISIYLYIYMYVYEYSIIRVHRTSLTFRGTADEYASRPVPTSFISPILLRRLFYEKLVFTLLARIIID